MDAQVRPEHLKNTRLEKTDLNQLLMVAGDWLVFIGLIFYSLLLPVIFLGNPHIIGFLASKKGISFLAILSTKEYYKIMSYLSCRVGKAHNMIGKDKSTLFFDVLKHLKCIASRQAH